MSKTLAIYQILLRSFGPQRWWPADSPFEVMVGAILTQQTNWGNVEKAIGDLKKARKLSPRAMLGTSNSSLQKLVRSSGYYRQKAKKLKIFCRFFVDEFGADIRKMHRTPTTELRARLLSLWGIGRETADSMLLYALGKPVFVVDAYTIRIGERVGLFRSGGYEHVRHFFESSLKRSVPLYKECHALLVELGKRFCRRVPLCRKCPLRGRCRAGSRG